MPLTLTQAPMSTQNVVDDQRTFDNTQAFAEGWAIFDDGELQRLDDGPIIGNAQSGEPVFADDLAAYKFVVDKAANGSEYHKQALAMLTQEEKQRFTNALL